MYIKYPAWMPVWIALLPPLTALGLQLVFWQWLKPLEWGLFYPAVFLSASVGGRCGGLWATGLSTLFAGLVFLLVNGSLFIHEFYGLLPALLFVGTGILFSHFQEQVKKSASRESVKLAALLSSNEQLEVRVQERSLELQASRESIRNGEARMAGIVGSAMDAIISVDNDQTIVLFNTAAQTMFQCSSEEALGQPLDRFIPRRFRQAHKAHVEGFGKTGVTTRSMHSLGALNGVRANGEEFPIEASISQIEVAGQKTYTVILRDITERKKDEEATVLLAAIVESSSDAIIGKDLSSIVTSWNAGAEKMFGYSAAEMVGSSITRIIPPDRQSEEEQILTRIKRGERVEHFETLRLHKTGGRVAVSVSVSPIKDTRGEVIGASKVARDITQRQRAESALKESEERMRLATEATGVGIWEWNVITHQIRWDAQLFRIYGIPVTADGSVAYSTWKACVLEEDIGKQEEILQDTVRRGGYSRREFRIRRAGDHSIRCIQAAETVRKGDNGETEWIVGTNLDITERRKAEQDLREKELQLHATDRRLAEIVQGMTEACFALDSEWNFTFVNDRGETLLRRPRHEMVGHRFWDVFPQLVGTPMEAKYRHSMRERVPLSFEVFSPVAKRWLDIRLFPSGDGLAAFLMDIDARKQGEVALKESEARYRGTLDTMMEGCQIIGHDWRYLYVNEIAARHGRQSSSHLLGRTMMECFPGIDSTPVFAAMKRCMAGGPPEQLENDFVYADGTKAAFQLGVQQVPEGIFVLSLDISERKKVQERIQQLNAELEIRVKERTAQLEAANKELESFSYSVSHDLRAPLRAMDGFSRALIEDYGPQIPGDGPRYLQIIRTSAQKMGALIDDLLAFSRLSRTPLHKRTINTKSLVEAALEDLEGQRKDRQVEIRIADLAACEGDPTLLKQVWINLLSNALKYSQKREMAVIEIGSSTEMGKTTYFVRDNGAGFDMRYAHKLFGVFQRLHRAEDYEGTGVGLAIVQRVIHRHGGTVWADSIVDHGTTFYFQI